MLYPRGRHSDNLIVDSEINLWGALIFTVLKLATSRGALNSLANHIDLLHPSSFLTLVPEPCSVSFISSKFILHRILNF